MEYSSLLGQYHACWCSGSYSRQSLSRHGIHCIVKATCCLPPMWISSAYVEPNPRNYSKCKDIFYDLLNNSACKELTMKHLVSITVCIHMLYDAQVGVDDQWCWILSTYNGGLPYEITYQWVSARKILVCIIYFNRGHYGRTALSEWFYPV